MARPIAMEQTNKEKRRKKIVYITSVIGTVSSVIPYTTGGFIRYFRGQEYERVANAIINWGHGTLIISAAAAAAAFANMALGHFIRSKHSKDLSESKTLESNVESESKVEKGKTDLERRAEGYIKAEKVIDKYNGARKGVDIKWKGENYGGLIQEIVLVPEYSRDILFLWKTNYPTDKKFLEFYEVVKKVNEEKKLGLERECLVADDNLNLDGWEHFVKRVENRLVPLNEEERVYVENNMDRINEILLNYPLKGTLNKST